MRNDQVKQAAEQRKTFNMPENNEQPETAALLEPLVMPHFWAENLKATISGVEYTWSGGFGAVLKSHERGVKKNDVRMIGKIVFFAFMVSNSGWLREVSWCPQREIDAEWLRRLKAAIFAA